VDNLLSYVQCESVFIEANNGLVTALATLVIAWFTVTLARSTIGLERLASDQGRAAIARERAFVFPMDVRPIPQIDAGTGKVVGWLLAVVWKNSGMTPTRNMYARVSIKPFPATLPDDFDFPDIGGGENVRLLVGPGAEIESSPLRIHDDVILVLAGKSDVARLYMWGWAEYNDIYEGTPRHRTEFCYEWSITGDVTNYERLSFRYTLHRKHNGADDECPRPLKTTGKEAI